MNLVIVESPAKAKTIEKYLGKDYKVLASKGHLVDLPKSNIGIDIEGGYKPEYIVTNPKALQQLKKAFKSSESLLLAVDSDREGEAIGWHIARELGVVNDKGVKKPKAKVLKRITFIEITKDAILEALNNPKNINMNMVDSQQARRVLDRLVGYKLSPLLWQKIRYGLSAGRVQSVALRLIVDREEERDKFDSQEYWLITAFLSDDKKLDNQKLLIVKKPENGDEKEIHSKEIPFKLSKVDGKTKEFKDQIVTDELINSLKNAKWTVKDITFQTSSRKPKPPFITSTLQQTSANKFGYSAKQTMKLAQDLYESGLITYMRTDSFNIAPQAIEQIRKTIVKLYGEENVSENVRSYTNNSKMKQEAHEAIRPTDFTKHSDNIQFSDKHKKIYNIIWQRTMATQMIDVVVESNKITVDAKNCEFQVIGQRIIKQGYLKAFPEKISEVELPKLEKGQKLFLDVLTGEQKFTEPPARYTEASLIKALEGFGIGRPSTYAPIISTISSRNYIEKEGRSLVPTDTGKVVIKLLKKHFMQIVDTGFTALIEDELDMIAQGNKPWVKVIDEFYKPFSKILETKKDELKREDFNVLGPSDEKCPICGKKMVIKLGRFGRFYSCKNFPDCKGMKALADDKIDNLDIESSEFLAKYQPSPKTDDGRNFLLKKGRFGYFWAHPDYPKIKDARPLELSKEMFKMVYGATPKSKDGKKMILRAGKFGQFWAHPDYPEVKDVRRINQKELAQKKQDLELL